MFQVGGIDLMVDTSFVQFFECCTKKFQLKLSETSGGAGLQFAFAFRLQLFSKCFQGRAPRRLAG